MKDIRWNAPMTIVWAALVILVSQILVGAFLVEQHARALGVSPTDANLTLFADAMVQTVLAGGALGILMIVGIVWLKKAVKLKHICRLHPLPYWIF